ncbi:H-NS histone family protein [Chromobacterium subtsugae]|uniref:H-NS histone family protein n=1 Tax=Chromobacterium subtsugae TaxID=251747 RepID=UPI0009BAD430|nr:H-NS histone family protein [Chromobacterium subtsugae]
MRDSNDKSTMELLPTPKKRGRPSTGSAMTNAQRQAKFRASRATNIHVELTQQEFALLVADLQCLVEFKPNLIRDRDRAIFQKIYRAGIDSSLPMPSHFATETDNDDDSVTVTENVELVSDSFQIQDTVTVTENEQLAAVTVQPDDVVTVTKTRSRPPVYHHPDNAMLTWSGRGRTPVWVQQWLQTGRTVHDLPRY